MISGADPVAGVARFKQGSFDHGFGTDQHDVQVVAFVDGVYRALNRMVRVMVASGGIDSDLQGHDRKGLVLGGCHVKHLTATVVTARRTCGVELVRSRAVRAGRQFHFSKFVVGTAGSGALFGVAAFWIWHEWS